MKEKWLKIKGFLKRYKRRIINGVVAVVLVCSIIINAFWHDACESYAMSGALGVAGALLSSDTVLSLLAICATLNGIVAHTDIDVNLGTASQEEKEAYADDVIGSQRDVFKMLYEGGYFDSTGLEDVVRDAVYGGNAALSLEAYVDSLQEDVGSDSEDDNRFNIIKWDTDGLKNGIFLSVGLLNKIIEAIDQALYRYQQAKVVDLVSNKVLPFDLPAEMPENPNPTQYVHYVMSTDGTEAGTFFYWLSPAVTAYVETGPNVDMCSAVCVDATYANVFKLENGEWVLSGIIPRPASTDTYRNIVYHYFPERTTDAKQVYEYVDSFLWFHDFSFKIAWKTLYGSYDVWRLTQDAKPYDPDGSPDVSADELEACVNSALEEGGYKTRYSIDAPGAAALDGVATNIDGVDADGVLISPNVIDNIVDIYEPVSNVIDKLIDGSISVDDAKTAINTAVDAGTDAIANDATNNISSEDKTLMTGTPFSPNWGPLANYEINGLEDVFPFCIPFDVARCIALLCAEPEAPRIEYPFRIERWGIDETIVLDMARFESVAAVSRWCETLGFIFFLVTKTRALMFS